MDAQWLSKNGYMKSFFFIPDKYFFYGKLKWDTQNNVWFYFRYKWIFTICLKIAIQSGNGSGKILF